MLTYVVEYSWLDTTRHEPDMRTQIATPTFNLELSF